MIGVELVKDRSTKEPLSESATFDIVLDLASLGLLVYYRRNVLGLLPPLIIDDKISDDIVAALDKALDTLACALGSFSRKSRLR